jgi:hypothetical protein
MAITKEGYQPKTPVKRSTVTTVKPTAGEGKHRKRKEGLQSVQQAVGLALMAAKQPADAAAVGEHGEPIIDELVKLGDSDEQIGKALDYLTKTGPYSALVMAALPLVFQIGVNHGRLKPNAMMPGVVSRETLEARAKSELAELQTAALREQREAEGKLRASQDELARQNGGFQNAAQEPLPENSWRNQETLNPAEHGY